MLQQTRVSTVIPYFNNFIIRFPNINSLAHASLDEILYFWSGLGYYARARNLHKAAKIIIEFYDGIFPSKFKDLISLPGIGRSTAGAILTFAYKKSYPILDANIKRILTRYYGIKDLVEKKETEKKLWKIIFKLTPIKNTDFFNQGMMDLGAIICTFKKPKCNLCPLKKNCFSFRKSCYQNFPFKKNKKKKYEKKYFLILKYKKYVFLKKRPNFGKLAGLFTFPEFEKINLLYNYIKNYKIKKNKLISLKKFNHSFTNIYFEIIPILISVNKFFFHINENNIFWYNLEKKSKIGLSSEIKKILNQIKNHKKKE